MGIGDSMSVTRSFSAADVHTFGHLIHDLNPLHFPEIYQQQQQQQQCSPSSSSPSSVPSLKFSGPIVHGMLSSSLFSSLFGTYIPSTIYLSQQLRFLSPIYYDQTVTAVITVKEFPKRKIVLCTTQINNTNTGKLLVDGEATVMIQTLKIKQ